MPGRVTKRVAPRVFHRFVRRRWLAASKELLPALVATTEESVLAAEAPAPAAEAPAPAAEAPAPASVARAGDDYFRYLHNIGLTHLPTLNRPPCDDVFTELLHIRPLHAYNRAVGTLAIDGGSGVGKSTLLSSVVVTEASATNGSTAESTAESTATDPSAAAAEDDEEQPLKLDHDYSSWRVTKMNRFIPMIDYYNMYPPVAYMYLMTNLRAQLQYKRTLLDRSCISNLAFQYVYALMERRIPQLTYYANCETYTREHNLEPLLECIRAHHLNILIIVDSDVDAVSARMRQRGGAGDAYKGASVDYIRCQNAAYAYLACKCDLPLIDLHYLRHKYPKYALSFAELQAQILRYVRCVCEVLFSSSSSSSPSPPHETDDRPLALDVQHSTLENFNQLILCALTLCGR